VTVTAVFIPSQDAMFLLGENVHITIVICINNTANNTSNYNLY